MKFKIEQKLCDMFNSDTFSQKSSTKSPFFNESKNKHHIDISKYQHLKTELKQNMQISDQNFSPKQSNVASGEVQNQKPLNENNGVCTKSSDKINNTLITDSGSNNGIKNNDKKIEENHINKINDSKDDSTTITGLISSINDSLTSVKRNINDLNNDTAKNELIISNISSEHGLTSSVSKSSPYDMHSVVFNNINEELSTFAPKKSSNISQNKGMNKSIENDTSNHSSIVKEADSTNKNDPSFVNTIVASDDLPDLSSLSDEAFSLLEQKFLDEPSDLYNNQHNTSIVNSNNGSNKLTLNELNNKSNSERFYDNNNEYERNFASPFNTKQTSSRKTPQSISNTLPRRKTSISSSNSSSSNQKLSNNNRPIRVGDMVEIGGAKGGLVRYVGETEFAKGEWVGLELNQPIGKNDGSVAGKR